MLISFSSLAQQPRRPNMSGLIVPVIILLIIALFAHLSLKSLSLKTDRQDRLEKYQDDRNIHQDKFSAILSVMNRIEASAGENELSAILLFKIKVGEFLELIKNDSYWWDNPYYPIEEMLQQAEFYFDNYGHSDKKKLLKFTTLPL